MKKNLSILCALSLALAGCSSDEPKGVTPEEKGEGYGYIAVNIVQSNSAAGPANAASAGRAESGFEDGTDGTVGTVDENLAKEGLFFIFDDAGNKVGEPQSIKLSGKGTGTNPAVERIYDGVLVIDGAENEPTNAKQIVCVLNAPSGLESVTTLAELQAKIGDYSAHESGTFIMTNAVYKNGEKTVIGAEVAGKIAQSAAEAYDNPVDIYVERVVAKVRYDAAPFTNNNVNAADFTGLENNLKIKVTGLTLANVADKAYLIKNVGGITFTPDWNWNDPTNKRSYWETVPAIGTENNQLQFTNETYNEIKDTDFDIKNLTGTEKYLLPNTSAQKTAVLVTAQLLDGSNNPADLAFIRGGYTTKDGAKNVIAQYLADNNNYWKKVTSTSGGATEIKELEPADFVWKDNVAITDANTPLKSYEVVAQLDPAKTFVICDHDGNVIEDGVTKVNDLLKSDAAKSYRAQVFNDGMCYYFVNIDHSTITGLTDTTLDGVVRNHLYILTLNSISGIGTPVFNPDSKIIPEVVDNGKTFYLSARVNVIPWKIVSQTVDFK